MEKGSSGILDASASSGNEVVFRSSTPWSCSVTDNTITAVEVGACIVAASQDGDDNYNPAPEVTKSITLTSPVKLDQTISFKGYPSSLVLGNSGTLSATSTSGLTVSFSSLTGSICSVSGSTVTATAQGLCVVAANQSGNSFYNLAPEVTRNITVTSIGKMDQTVSFTGYPSSLEIDSSGSLSATATSGLTVDFSSKTPDVCTVSGSAVIANNQGTCVVAASQAGNSLYNPSPEVIQTITITIPTKQNQTISFDGYPTVLEVGSSGLLSAAATSGLSVSFTSETSSICSISGSIVTALSTGSCIVAANQIGDDTYNPAPVITREIIIAEFPGPVIPGDINDDESVNLQDLILSLRLLSGSVLSENTFLEADVNNDSRIGVEEAIYILRKTAGLTPDNNNAVLIETFEESQLGSIPTGWINGPWSNAGTIYATDAIASTGSKSVFVKGLSNNCKGITRPNSLLEDNQSVSFDINSTFGVASFCCFTV